MKSKIYLIITLSFLFSHAYSQRYYNRKYKPGIEERGFRNGLDFSTTIGDYLATGIDYTASWQFNSYIQTGVGVGVSLSPFLTKDVSVIFPIYADVRFNLLSKKTTPFVGLKVGGAAGISNYFSYFLDPSIGCRLNTGGTQSVSFSLGFTMLKGSDVYIGCDCDEDRDSGKIETFLKKAFSFRVFYQF